MERTLEAAASADVTVITPKPGQSLDPKVTNQIVRWWPKVPVETAKDTPIVSSRLVETPGLP